jgi:hypothetical protein
MQLKADSFILLSHKIENTIMPMLRLQKGFKHGITTVVSERSTATEDTFWNTKEAAEEYESSAYLEVKEILSNVISDKPITSIFESSDSAFN